MTGQSERRWCAWCGALIANVGGAAYIDKLSTGELSWACDAACLAELVAAQVARREPAR